MQIPLSHILLLQGHVSHSLLVGDFITSRLELAHMLFHKQSDLHPNLTSTIVLMVLKLSLDVNLQSLLVMRWKWEVLSP